MIGIPARHVNPPHRYLYLPDELAQGGEEHAKADAG